MNNSYGIGNKFVNFVLASVSAAIIEVLVMVFWDEFTTTIPWMIPVPWMIPIPVVAGILFAFREELQDLDWASSSTGRK